MPSQELSQEQLMQQSTIRLGKKSKATVQPSVHDQRRTVPLRVNGIEHADGSNSCETLQMSGAQQELPQQSSEASLSASVFRSSILGVGPRKQVLDVCADKFPLMSMMHAGHRVELNQPYANVASVPRRHDFGSSGLGFSKTGFKFAASAQDLQAVYVRDARTSNQAERGRVGRSRLTPLDGPASGLGDHDDLSLSNVGAAHSRNRGFGGSVSPRSRLGADASTMRRDRSTQPLRQLMHRKNLRELLYEENGKLSKFSHETNVAIKRSLVTLVKNNWNERPYMALQYLTEPPERRELLP